MKRPNLPPLQGKRFDIETLQYHAVSLAEQADKGPTFLRYNGRVAYVMMTEEVFDKFWPDPRRAWSIAEMPLRIEKLFFDAIELALSDRGEHTD